MVFFPPTRVRPVPRFKSPRFPGQAKATIKAEQCCPLGQDCLKEPEILTSQNTPQFSYIPPPQLRRHPSFKRCRMRLCVPGYFSSLHLKQLIDLRLGERDGEGGGQRGKKHFSSKSPALVPYAFLAHCIYCCCCYYITHPLPNKKKKTSKESRSPHNIPGRSPGEAGGIIQRHLPQLPMESGPFILLINLHGDSERKRREKKGSEAGRRQEGRTPKNVLDLYLLSHVLQG